MKDELFTRGSLPMTKSEVRAVSLSKLELVPGAVFWDVGAGTGSVSVEAARLLCQAGGEGQIYAVEREPEGIRLIQENKEKLAAGFLGFHVIEGEAPGCLNGLPSPSHVFIGGSGGALRQIVEVVLEKNERARIVANVAALETLAQCMEIMEAIRFKEQEIVQVAAARVERMGRYHLQKAMNPVFVVTMQFPVYMGEKT